MRRTWQVSLVGALLALAVVVPAGRVTAAGQRSGPVFDPRSLPGDTGKDDYVCQVIWEPPEPGAQSSGTFGALYVEFYNEPNCQGGYVGSARFYSKGATAGFADARYLVSETMLQTLSLMLQRAAGKGQRVNWTNCDPGGNYSCLRSVAIVGTDAVR